MKVLLVHCDLSQNGGAETYAFDIIRVLESMGARVGTLDVSGHRFDGKLKAALPIHFRAFLHLFPNKFLLAYALVCRFLAQMTLDYDAVVFSYGEGPAVGPPGLRILHAPVLFSAAQEDIDVLQAGTTGPRLWVRQVYARLCRQIARPVFDHRGTRTISNSAWTAARAHKRAKMVTDAVIHPRVQAGETTAETGEPGHFLMIGRIVENKRHKDAIDMIRHLRCQGIDARLTIVGRVNCQFGRRFVRDHRHEPGVTLVPDACETEKRHHLKAARFGVHCFRHEHFGIGVAEMILAGLVPLVFAGGGVTEMVQPARLQFSDVADLQRRALELCRLSDDDVTALSNRLRSRLAKMNPQSFDARMRAELGWVVGKPA